MSFFKVQTNLHFTPMLVLILWNDVYTLSLFKFLQLLKNDPQLINIVVCVNWNDLNDVFLFAKLLK